MLSVRQLRSIITVVFAASEHTGTTPPKEVTHAYDRLKTLQLAYADRPRTSAHDVAVAIIAAIEDGRTPETDPDVQRLLTVMDLAGRSGLAETIDTILIASLRDAIGNGDALVDSWRPSFDKAASTIHDAQAKLGGLNLTDTDEVVRRGTAATTAWQKATEAVRTIDTIDKGWTALQAAITSSFEVNKTYALLRIAAITPDQWLDRNLAGRPADPWAAALDGLELALPTFDEYGQRVDSMTRAAQDRTAGAERSERQRRNPAITAS